MAKAKSVHYVDNEKFLKEMKIYKKQYDDAKKGMCAHLAAVLRGTRAEVAVSNSKYVACVFNDFEFFSIR